MIDKKFKELKDIVIRDYPQCKWSEDIIENVLTSLILRWIIKCWHE